MWQTMCFSSLGHEIKLSTKYTHETDRHIIDSMVETIRIRPLELMMTIESQQIETHKSIRELERHTHTHSHDYMVWWAWTPISPIKLLPPLCYDRIVIIRYKTSDPIKSRLGEDCVFQFVASMIGKYLIMHTRYHSIWLINLQYLVGRNKYQPESLLTWL